MSRRTVALKALFTVILLALVLRQVDPRHVVSLVADARPWLLVLAVLIAVLTALANVWKWELLLQALHVRLPWKRATYHYFFAYFLNNFLTGMGDVKRIYDTGRETGQPPQVFVSVFIERWTGALAQLSISMACVGLAALTVSGLGYIALLNLAGLAVVLAAYLLAMGFSGGFLTRMLARRPLVKAWLDKAGTALRALHDRRALLCAAVGISAGVALAFVAIHVLLAWALGITVPLGTFALMVPLAVLFGQVPVSINGLGIQEVAYLALFRLSGLTADQAVAVSMLAHAVKLGVGALGGLAGMWDALSGARRVPSSES